MSRSGKPRPRAATGGPPGQVRIIGGRWRGRKLPVRDLPGLRPTPDRVRETLFNWLQGDLPGACCLDLFAGTGALGLEALSRGAASCTFVDADAGNIRHIQHALTVLGATGQARCVARTAAQALAEGLPAADILFLDPPFADRLLPVTAAALMAAGVCTPATLIYVESALPGPEGLPPAWALLKDGRAGQVCYQLYRGGSLVDAP